MTHLCILVSYTIDHADVRQVCTVDAHNDHLKIWNIALTPDRVVNVFLSIS